MSEWLAMGGYGAYVWSAYGIALGLLGGLALQTRLRERRLIRKLKRRSARR